MYYFLLHTPLLLRQCCSTNVDVGRFHFEKCNNARNSLSTPPSVPCMILVFILHTLCYSGVVYHMLIWKYFTNSEITKVNVCVYSCVLLHAYKHTEKDMPKICSTCHPPRCLGFNIIANLLSLLI